jgi:hypothetical protein
VLETIPRIKRYLTYAMGIMTAYALRPPIEVLGRCFHEIGHGLYQWVGTGFGEFPGIVFLNKYMAAYSPWLGKKVLLYGKNLYRALLGSYVDPIVGSAASPSEEYLRFLHDHPIQYASYSAAGPLFGVAYSMTIMLVGMKMMKNGNPIYKSLGALSAMTGVFSYIPEAAWAIRRGQDYWIMDFYANPMDDMVKAFVVLFAPGIVLRKIRISITEAGIQTSKMARGSQPVRSNHLLVPRSVDHLRLSYNVSHLSASSGRLSIF